MDQIFVCSNKIPSVTTVRNSFIRKYMPDANGSYVKVYLYLSMCIQSGHTDLSISSLADMMENTENDIIRALQHWEKKNLLRITWHESGEYIVGIEFLDPDGEPEAALAEQTSAGREDAHTAAAPAALPALSATPPESNATLPELSAAPPELNATLSKLDAAPLELDALPPEDSDFTWICQIVETFLNRPIKPTEVQLLTYLFHTLHFSKDLILHLYDYCISLGKSSVPYIQAVALSWAENNITTPEQAQEFSAVYSSAHAAISKALGLNRVLAGIECQYVKKWHDQWHMDLAVILEACNRTMLAIQKPDFKYLDGILKKWQQEGVHTLQDVAHSDEEYARKHPQTDRKTSAPSCHSASPSRKNQFQDFPQRTMPEEKMNQLERLLLSE